MPAIGVRTGHLKVVVASIIWGSIGLVARTVPAPAAIIVFYRVFFASLFLAISFAIQRRWDKFQTRGQTLLLVVTGCFAAINWLLFFAALNLTSVASAVLASYVAPVFIAVLAAIILGERLEKISGLALAMAMAGIGLMVLPGQDGANVHAVGVFLGAASGFFYASEVICCKVLVRKLAPDSVNFFAMGVAAVVTLPFLFFQPFALDGRSLAALLVLGGFHTALAISLYYSALRQVKAQVAGVLSYLEPVSAAVFAALFLGEHPTPETYLGGLLVILAGLATTLAGAETVEKVED